MKRTMGKILLRGFLGIAPLAITIILLIWLYNHLEFIFGAPIAYFFPKIYFPGLGIIIAIITLFLLGLLLNYWFIEYIYQKFENLLKRIPLLKTIYISVTDLMSFFDAGDKTKHNKVVSVTISGIKMIGLVTRNSFEDLPKGVGTNQDIVVFFPFSYQIGGITAIVPKSLVTPVDMTVEKGLRFMATGGKSGDSKPL
jgi:uncharacterized membrane protein